MQIFFRSLSPEWIHPSRIGFWCKAVEVRKTAGLFSWACLCAHDLASGLLLGKAFLVYEPLLLRNAGKHPDGSVRNTHNRQCQQMPASICYQETGGWSLILKGKRPNNRWAPQDKWLLMSFRLPFPFPLSLFLEKDQSWLKICQLRIKLKLSD